jgi:predicted ATPase
LAIATAGNRGLDRAFHGLDGPDHADLVAARADLHDAAATEHRFDRSLLAIVFPSAIEATAHAVVGVNEARAILTAKAAVSASLQQLRRYEQQLSAANEAVVQQVRILRTQLGLPPAETG